MEAKRTERVRFGTENRAYDAAEDDQDKRRFVEHGRRASLRRHRIVIGASGMPTLQTEDRDKQGGKNVFHFREWAGSCNMPAFTEGFRRSPKEKECFAQSAELIWRQAPRFARVAERPCNQRRCPGRCRARRRNRRTEHHSLQRRLPQRLERFLRTGCPRRQGAMRDSGCVSWRI